MKNYYLLLGFLFTSGLTYSQGSGKCVVLDGSNDNVELSGYPDMGAASNFSITAWIYTTDKTKAGQRIFCDDQNNNNGCYALSLGDPGSGRLRFYIRGLSVISLDVAAGSAYLIENNTWYHVAAVHDAATKTKYIYVNGELAASGTYTGSIVNCAGPAAIGGEPNGSPESGNRFSGRIDEVTTWSKALSQAEIKAMVCKLLTGAEANLTGYWRFDEGAGTTANYTGVGYTGTLTNGPTWATSGAALGNTSAYLYTGAWGGKTLYLASPEGDSLQVNTVAGTTSPYAMHIYHVNAVPNSTTGINGIGGNDHYFGVFKAGGTSVTYTAVYHYEHNDSWQASNPGLNETDLLLFRRANNSVASWTNTAAALNTGVNTLTSTANSTEFMLGIANGMLPIELVSFNAVANQNNEVELSWQTASEINNDYFTIERSANGKEFEEVMRVDGAGNSNQVLDYFERDYFPLTGLSFYRLKQTDYDGAFTYSDVVAVKRDNTLPEFTVYPNPVSEGDPFFVAFTGFGDEEVLVVVRDIQGREFYSKVIVTADNGNVVAFDPDQRIPAGTYLVIASSNEELHTQKLIVK